MAALLRHYRSLMLQCFLLPPPGAHLGYISTGGLEKRRKAKVDFFLFFLELAGEALFRLAPHIRTAVIFFFFPYLLCLCLSLHESFSGEQGSFGKVKLFHTSLAENSPGHVGNALSWKYIRLDAGGSTGKLSLEGEV